VRRLAAIPVLALGVLAGCGPSATTVDLDKALTVELPGFVSAAGRGTPTTLCDAEPTGTGVTPPSLPAELGTSATVFYEQAQSTVEAYAWPAVSAEAARQMVDEAASAASECEFELSTDADTDGDGALDTGVSEVQTVEPWSGSGWEGVRIHRVVSGQEQVDRRLVHRDAVVLLLVLRADTDDPVVLTSADDFLEAVAEDLG
jgi:hypothetical protein